MSTIRIVSTPPGGSFGSSFCTSSGFTFLRPFSRALFSTVSTMNGSMSRAQTTPSGPTAFATGIVK